jgi:hypothetical protein
VTYAETADNESISRILSDHPDLNASTAEPTQVEVGVGAAAAPLPAALSNRRTASDRHQLPGGGRDDHDLPPLDTTEPW